MNEDSLNLLKRAIQSRSIGAYSKAQEYLDKLIETEPESHLLWYEKSKLPILQEDSITIRSRTISLTTYQRLPLADKNNYLQQCGFDIAEIPEIEGHLSVPNLVAAQRDKYLKLAIIYAPEKEAAIYTAELDTIAATITERNRKNTRAAVFMGLIALCISVAGILLLNTFYKTPFFQMPMNVVIVLLVSYTLSVTGMVLYTKTKNNGNGTTMGLVLNLLALIISNLSIINTIILFTT